MAAFAAEAFTADAFTVDAFAVGAFGGAALFGAAVPVVRLVAAIVVSFAFGSTAVAVTRPVFGRDFEEVAGILLLRRLFTACPRG